MANGMTIGDLSGQTDTPVETIRYYEREGLLPPPPRSAGNYRLYTEFHAGRLVFIRNCRKLNMALDEIRMLLAFRDNPSANCDTVSRVLEDHASHVATRIAELQLLQKELGRLRKLCRKTKMARECEILDGLTGRIPVNIGKVGHVHGSHAKTSKKRDS